MMQRPGTGTLVRLAGIQTYSNSFMCTKLLASEHFADVKMSVCLIDAGSV